MFSTRKMGWAVAAAAALALAGCGGGDDSTPVTPAATAQVPASASASVAGMVSYLQALIASSADTLQPVDLSSYTPPTSDTTPPTPLN